MAEDRILTDREWLLHLADLLEGEGMEAGPVQLDEDFAQMLAARLRGIAEGREGEWVSAKPRVEYDLDSDPVREESDEQAN